MELMTSGALPGRPGLLGAVRPKSGHSLDQLVAPLGVKYGHHELVKHPAYLLLGIANVLVLVSLILTAVTFQDRIERHEGLTWRSRFVAESRRHPRVRTTQLACLTAAFVLCVSYFVTLFA